MAPQNSTNETLDLDLWIVNPSTIRSAALLSNYYKILSGHERERHAAFANEKLRHDFLVTRGFVRELLSQTVNHSIAPYEWKFGENANGRPDIQNPQFQGKLHFNISHTQNLIACLVGPIYDIGLDVEHITRNVDYFSLAETCFSKSEYTDLTLQRTSRELRDRFFQYWTLKEAYIKARGIGVSLPLQQFSYNIDPSCNHVSISFEAPLVDSSSAWQFKVFQETPSHLLSMALKNEGRPWRIQRRFLPRLTAA